MRERKRTAATIRAVIGNPLLRKPLALYLLLGLALLILAARPMQTGAVAAPSPA